jgi:hypothetical protein
VKRSPLDTISAFADNVLAEVEQAQVTKTAEVVAVRAATPKSEISVLMHKVAEDLRSTSVDVTYDDIAEAMGSHV